MSEQIIIEIPEVRPDIYKFIEKLNLINRLVGVIEILAVRHCYACFEIINGCHDCQLDWIIKVTSFFKEAHTIIGDEIFTSDTEFPGFENLEEYFNYYSHVSLFEVLEVEVIKADPANMLINKF